MSHLKLHRAETYLRFGPGTWFRTRGLDPLVLVCCARCGERASLGRHTIASDGIVEPSLRCPAGCGWHASVQLLDWNGEG